MANLILGVFYPLAIIFAIFGAIKGHPITKEDADSLLPEIPKTKNETVAALVQDAVVQQAVQSIVGDGSLSGLVVKKNTVILPANAPDVVLSHNEQILKAPLTDLENIRKNITETAAALNNNENSSVTKIDEISLGEIIPLNENNSTNLISEATQNLIKNTEIEVPKKLITNIDEKEPEEKIFTQSLILSGLIGDKISDIGLSEEGKSEPLSLSSSSLSSLSSSSIDESSLEKSSSSFEEKNEEFENNDSSEEESSSNESRDESLEFGARIPVLPVIIDDQYNSRPAVKIETINASAFNEGIQSDVLIAKRKNLIAIFTSADDEGLDYQNRELEDMAAAEDIIFRPLFRYREQQNERTRVLENRAYQRLGYKYNNRRDNYKRRRPYYYSDYNYNYNKRPQKTKYYDDYN